MLESTPQSQVVRASELRPLKINSSQHTQYRYLPCKGGNTVLCMINNVITGLTIVTIHLQKRLTLLIFIGPKVETSSEYMVYFMVIINFLGLYLHQNRASGHKVSVALANTCAYFHVTKLHS